MPNKAGPKVKLTDYQIDFVIDNFMPRAKAHREGLKRYAKGVNPIQAFNCTPKVATGRARLYKRIVETANKLNKWRG